MEKLRMEIAGLQAKAEDPSEKVKFRTAISQRVRERQQLLDDLLQKCESSSVE